MAQRQNNETELPDDGILQKGVRQIVLSRETIPRAPRWARAFRHTLLRFVRDIAESEEIDANPPTASLSEENHHDQR
jgi:hypothetical protein